MFVHTYVCGIIFLKRTSIWVGGKGGKRKENEGTVKGKENSKLIYNILIKMYVIKRYLKNEEITGRKISCR